MHEKRIVEHYLKSLSDYDFKQEIFYLQAL